MDADYINIGNTRKSSMSLRERQFGKFRAMLYSGNKDYALFTLSTTRAKNMSLFEGIDEYI